MTYLLITLVAIICIGREIATYKTIKSKDDLIDRMTNKLMAKDFKEYHETTQPLVTYAPVMNDDMQLYMKEIEDNKV